MAVAAAIRDSDFEAWVDGGGLRMRGTADGRSAERLEDLVTQTHRTLIARQTRAFTIDLRQLAQLSDSCFNVFVTWIGLVQMLPEPQRYRLQFAIDPAATWQRRAVVTLSAVGTGVVELGS